MRIANRYPAGYVEARSPFLRENRNGILGLVNQTESRVTNEDPLERIIKNVYDNNEDLLITTTGVLTARGIDEVRAPVYGKNLGFQSADDEEFIRVLLEPWPLYQG